MMFRICQTATVSIRCFLCCWNRHCSQAASFPAGADPGCLKGGGGSRLGLPAKKGAQTGVQFWAQC